MPSLPKRPLGISPKFIEALIHFALTCTAPTLFGAAPVVAEPRFENLGLGGGGAMYVPVCSPHDHNLMFVACDMGGVYRSTDGGGSWQMLDQRQLRHDSACAMVFHPADPARIYAASGAQLHVSDDRGEHWCSIAKPIAEKGESITAIGVEPTKGDLILVGTTKGVWSSQDRSASFVKRAGAPGGVIGFVFDPRESSAGGAVFAGTPNGIYRSGNGGAAWEDASAGLPSRSVRGLWGGADAQHLALYCTVPGKDEGGTFAGGVFLSLDGGSSWQSAMGEGINTSLGKKDRYGIDDVPQYHFLSGSRTQPGTVFVTTRGTGYHPPYHWTVYRTDDFGKSWRYCLTGDPREKTRNVESGWLPLDINLGFGGPATGFSVCENDPQIAMFTNNAELYVTRDAAQSWQCAYSRRATPEGAARPGEAWQSCGLEVTSCWQLAFDPHDPKRAYTCYTDIGFARSEDGGKSWLHSVEGSPWNNSFYQILFEPGQPGVIYAACANQHDIPTWTNVDKVKAGGGICVSHDFGAHWQALNQGLPDAPVTSIAMDTRSPADQRTLYAAVFGHGVFKSVDAGATWHDLSQGLGVASNRHIYSVKVTAEGAVLCSITGQRGGTTFAEGSGLYRSTDGGATWSRISPPLKWAGDFAIDPVSSRTMYLTASTPPGHSEGGLYKTEDDGVTWKRLIKDADLPQDLGTYIHAFFVTIHPRHSNRVFFSTHSHGLLVSDDAGATWREVRGVPFTAVNRVAFDPKDNDTIWVTTFGGGLWKGKVSTPGAP